eukprot:5047147-Amphidinium_carterae.1
MTTQGLVCERGHLHHSMRKSCGLQVLRVCTGHLLRRGIALGPLKQGRGIGYGHYEDFVAQCCKQYPETENIGMKRLD